MSERKVLTKYYPPDFDPRQLTRKKGPKPTGPRVQTVRLMAPFSMKCTSCGEYIYKGRKFNARKETPEAERYLGIQIYRFYIRCTRCSSEITFKTDPKNQDYTCEKGAKRSTEPWRRVEEAEETDEQRLDRLEREEEEERNAMEELEAKTVDAKREMAVADALDEIRTRNARLERADRDGLLGEALVGRPTTEADEQRRREEEEDAAAWARAQEGLEEAVVGEEEEEAGGSGSNSNGEASRTSSSSASGSMPPPPPPLGRKTEESPPVANVKRKADEETPAPSFKRQAKKKKEVLLPGIKKKPSLV